MIMTLEERIRRYEDAKMLAIRMHGIQDYDGFPYQKHLGDVENVLLDHGYDQYGDHAVAAFLHDILEDCPISYNDIKKQFGEKIAEIVYCVTDELGRNRKERKSKTYPKIRSNPDAIPIKLADRIANVQNAIKHKHSMLGAYVKEHEEFRKQLYYKEGVPVLEGARNSDERVEALWTTLDKLMVEINEIVA
jgi:(p)ppGpp synthase/HD superfamily hydrolase